MSQHFDPAEHVILTKEETGQLHRLVDLVELLTEDLRDVLRSARDTSLRGEASFLREWGIVHDEARKAWRILDKAQERLSPPLPQIQAAPQSELTFEELDREAGEANSATPEGAKE